MLEFRIESSPNSKEQLLFALRLTSSQDEYVHSHDYFEIFIITYGTITHNCLYEKQPLNVGDAYLIAPKTPHSFLRHENKPCSHRDFMISDVLVKQACDYLSPDLYQLLIFKKCIHFHLSLKTTAYLEEKIEEFLNSTDTPKKKNIEKLITAELLSYLYFQKSNTTLEISDFKTKCIELMNALFVLPNALECIREELGYNKIYFSRKFHETFGVTPTEQINSLKLDHAAYLLSSANCSLQECCDAIGISSLSYFIKIFKQKFGMTPTAYKQSQNQ